MTMLDQPVKKSMSDYKANSRQRLRERGGKAIYLELEADDIAALKTIRQDMGLRTDKEAIALALAFWVSENARPSLKTRRQRAV